MSYCVNCGVELDANAKVCPLCQTPVWHPDTETAVEPYFPTQPAQVEPVSKKGMILLLTSMLASAAVCCGLINLLLPFSGPWSLYVIGAAVMLWIWFVFPLILRWLPTFFKLTLDVAAVGIYLYLISLDLNGSDWFRGLALPLLGVACAVVFLLSFLLRGNRRSRISALCLVIGAVALFGLGAEYCIDMYLRGVWEPGWSIVTLIVCIGLIIPLRVIRRVPVLREEARRRFSL